jgi:hypothetical protein
LNGGWLLELVVRNVKLDLVVPVDEGGHLCGVEGELKGIGLVVRCCVGW